ncbi:hypothetical protein HZB00_04250 [Candidatus Woesearchaeota archaeon]|nr:hypothetical protein [Candidatus Woesearchaeota archaeon]
MEQEGVNEQKVQQQITALENIAKQFMSSEAITRYGALKSAHPQKALQVVAIISQLAQQGQVKEKLTDAQFKQLLMQLEPQKRETKIKR